MRRNAALPQRSGTAKHRPKTTVLGAVARCLRQVRSYGPSSTAAPEEPASRKGPPQWPERGGQQAANESAVDKVWD